jgi:hypothetical protein
MVDYSRRLPPAALGALYESGWRPERSVSVDVWHDVLGAEGFVLHSMAREVLTGFGGLLVPTAVEVGAFRNGPILFEPELAGSGSLDIAHELRQMFEHDFYPIAEWITNSCVYLGSRGKVVDHHDVDLLGIGESFEAALHVMLLADRSLPVLRTY